MHSVERAARLIKEADALIFTSGAGLGVGSGLSPTECGANVPYGMDAQRIMSSDPLLAWGYSVHRYKTFSLNHPHAGYDMMIAWGKQKARPFAVFTSNIDGHWSKALARHNCNSSSTPLVEDHGSINLMQCHNNCAHNTWASDHGAIMASHVDAKTGKAGAYHFCPACLAPSRFNVGLSTDNDYCARPRDAQLTAWDAHIGALGSGSSCRVVVIEVGASTALTAVRQKSAELTRTLGASLVRINAIASEIVVKRGGDGGDDDIACLIANNHHVSIDGMGALEALSAIDEQIKRV